MGADFNDHIYIALLLSFAIGSIVYLHVKYIGL